MPRQSRTSLARSRARGSAKRGAKGRYARRSSPKKRSPRFKRTPSGGVRQSARRYRDDGGKWGDLNLARDKVLARRATGSPYWKDVRHGHHGRYRAADPVADPRNVYLDQHQLTIIHDGTVEGNGDASAVSAWQTLLAGTTPRKAFKLLTGHAATGNDDVRLGFQPAVGRPRPAEPGSMAQQLELMVEFSVTSEAGDASDDDSDETETLTVTAPARTGW